jgi:hypothetical protein
MTGYSIPKKNVYLICLDYSSITPIKITTSAQPSISLLNGKTVFLYEWEKLLVLYRAPFFPVLMQRQVALLHIPKKTVLSPISQILPWSYETSNRGIINWGDLTIMKALS